MTELLHQYFVQKMNDIDRENLRGPIKNAFFI